MKTIRSFLRDDDAAVAIEAVIMTPILAWCFIASFVFFDAFRTYSSSVKATYAVADIISRQDQAYYDSDVQGYADVFRHIMRNPGGTSMRVSLISWLDDLNGGAGGYWVDKSGGLDGETQLREADLENIVDRLPILTHREQIILVETFIPYQPAFNLGLDDIEFTNFTVIRPRYAPFSPWTDGNDPECSSCNFNDGTLDVSKGYEPIFVFDTADGDYELAATN